MKELLDELNQMVKLRRLDMDNDSIQWLEIATEKCLEWTGTEVPKSIADSKKYLESLDKNSDIDFWIIADFKSNKMIGLYWIANPIIIESQTIVTAEAQRLSEKYWRSGIMKTVRKVVYSYYFSEMKVDVIYAQAWKENISSCKSMENIGFVLSKSEYKYFQKKDGYYIENEYILIPSSLSN